MSTPPNPPPSPPARPEPRPGEGPPNSPQAESLLTGMLALELGLVTQTQLDEGLREQEGKIDSPPIGEILRARGSLTSGQLQRLLAEQKARLLDFSEARLFGQVALDRNFATPKKLAECLREQIRSGGREQRPHLGEIMMAKGYLRRGEFSEILRIQGKVLFQCAECGVLEVRAASLPLEGANCARCGKFLRIVQETTAASDPAPRFGDTTYLYKAPLAKLGKFEILNEVARGGMGIVFKAHDATLDRTVALKVLKEGDADPTLIVRLQREGALAAKLHHPNIVTVHEVGQTSGLHYLCMDFVEGVDLLEFVRREKPGRRRLLRLIETIARAVHYAHARGVVHRDLKPSNILIQPDGTPVITDFGLARSLDASFRITKEGAAMGTPLYMPPEQVLGRSEAIDPRSDVYSLGVILYELLTGRPPFAGATVMEIYQKILSEEPTRPTTLEATLDPDLEAICLKAMEKEPELRYMSAEDLAIDLGRHLAGEPVLARRATGARLLARKLRKNQRKILTIAAAFAIAVGGTLAWIAVRRARKVAALEAEADRAFDKARWGRARELYLQVVALDEGRSAASRRIGVCDERLAAARREADSEVLRRAEEERAAKRAGARPFLDSGFRKFTDALTYMHQPGFDPPALDRRFRDAADDLTRAIERDPDFADAYFLRGRCRENLRQVLEAEKDYTQAIAKSPNFSAAYFERGRLRYERSFTESGARYGNLGKTAGFSIQRKARRVELERAAREDFEKAVVTSAEAPREDERALMAAFADLADDRYDAAVADFTRSIESNKVNPEAHFGRGYAYVALGHFDRAIESFTEAIRLQPNLYPAYSLRAVAWWGKGDLDRALAEYEEAARRFPHSGTYYNMAILLGIKGRFEEALGALERALEEEPDDLTMRTSRAACLFQLGRASEALKDLQWVLDKDPRFVEACKLMAVCTAALCGPGDQARRDIALGYFEKSAELDPDDDQNLSNWASTRADAGDLDGAWETAARALALNPKNAHAFVVRGGILRFRGDLEKALEEIDKALALDPDYARAHFQRALALYFLDRCDDALAEIERARKDPRLASDVKRLTDEIRTKMGKK